MTFRRSNLADVAAQFFPAVAGRGCYLALQIFLAHSLGPRDFGIYAIGWTVIGLIGTLVPIGMPQAILRYCVTGRRALHAAPMIVATIFGLAGLLLLLGTADLIANRIFGEPDAAAAIRALAPSVPLLSIFLVLMAALRSSDANLSSGVIGAMVSVLYFTATVLAFNLVDPTAETAGHMYGVAIALTLPPAAWILWRLPSRDEMPRLSRLMQFGLVTMFINSANVLNLWADRFVLGMMVDAREVGIYQIASQMAVVGIVLRAAVITVFEARVPKSNPDGTPPSITREFMASSRLLLHISAPGLICLAFTASFWIQLLFGEPYRAAALPLAVLILGQLGLTFMGPAVNALHMTGEEHMAMRLTIITCVLNVAGNVALIPRFGLVGSATASCVANIAVGAISLWRLHHTGRLRAYFRRVADVAIGTAICAVVTAAVIRWPEMRSLPGMLGVLAAAYAVYAVVLLALCREHDEAVDLTRRMLARACTGKIHAP